MHELGKFIQHLMDQESMDRPDLVRRSGLTRQHVQQLLTLDEMQMPKPATIEALCRAFPFVPVRAFVLKAAASAGIPVGDEDEPDYSLITNETLIEILAARLMGGTKDAGQAEAQKNWFDLAALPDRDDDPRDEDRGEL